MVIILFLLLLFPLGVHGQVAPEDCLGCHETYDKVSHKGVTCTACHRDITSLPHGEKLAKPACKACHARAERAFASTVHQKAGMTCKTCHQAHAVTADKKECASCHGQVAHKRLPSKEKHLAALTCAACHGRGGKYSAVLTVTATDKGAVTRQTVDADGNKRIDPAEWNNLATLLERDFKGAFSVRREYGAAVDVHSVGGKALACKACHGEKTVYRETFFRFQGKTTFQMAADRRLLIPALPSAETFRETVHGRKGVRCADCHVSQERISDGVCASCHEEVERVYRGTVHAVKGATRCTDCHNPHNIKSYRELNAAERLGVCARCHKNYADTHRWLPNTKLHFDHLECSTCHSPQSTKSIVFEFRVPARGNGKEQGRPLSYRDLVDLYGPGTSVVRQVDQDGGGTVDSRELLSLYHDLSRGLGRPPVVATSIVVTKVFHDYSQRNPKGRVCRTCHSLEAPFYDSVYLILPDKPGNTYIPAKNTVLSALPTSVFTDVAILGGDRIRARELTALLRGTPTERAEVIRDLGFKWLDLIGIGLIILTALFLVLHALARGIFRR